MPNTVSYTHTHTHSYLIDVPDRDDYICDCGSTPADTALRKQYGITVVQIPGIEVWTITRNGEGTNDVFLDYNAATTAANFQAHQASKE